MQKAGRHKALIRLFGIFSVSKIVGTKYTNQSIVISALILKAFFLLNYVSPSESQRHTQHLVIYKVADC